MGTLGRELRGKEPAPQQEVSLRTHGGVRYSSIFCGVAYGIDAKGSISEFSLPYQRVVPL